MILFCFCFGHTYLCMLSVYINLLRKYLETKQQKTEMIRQTEAATVRCKSFKT